MADEGQNPSSFPSWVFHRRRGSRGGVPQTCLVNTGLICKVVFKCVHSFPTCQGSGNGAQTRGQGCNPRAGRASSFLSTSPLRLIRVPLPALAPPSLRPTDLPAAQRNVASGDPSLWRDAEPVAKGRDHPAPWGRRFRRNRPPPHTPGLGSSRLTLPSPSRAGPPRSGGKVLAL